MKPVLCARCGKPVPPDEVALNLRLLGMQIGCFYCVDCLSEKLHTGTDYLNRLIDRFKQMGCTYFTRLSEEETHGESENGG